MALVVTTWNINSVRLRIELVKRLLEETQPDVLCLQEIKCRNDAFPRAALAELGYVHQHVVGQKGWHGVATVSRLPLEELEAPAFCQRGEARVAASRVAGVTIHNLYVPAGGDEADPEVNPKFAHKLDFLARMEADYAARSPGGPLLVAGDLNVAPGEHDVWSHKDLLKVVSHTPVETTTLDRIRDRGGFVDLARRHHPPEHKLFTWWSYRAADWAASNRGRRLDHIWTSPDLAERLEPGGWSARTEARGWEKPSDHVPVTCRFTS